MVLYFGVVESRQQVQRPTSTHRPLRFKGAGRYVPVVATQTVLT